MSGKSSGKLSVKMKDLKLHPILAENSEVLAAIQYSLNSITDLSPEAFNWLRNFHPIFVIHDKSNGYQVISGIRIYNIAARLFPADFSINVNQLENISFQTIKTAIYADLFLTPLAFSMHHAPKTLLDIFRILPDKTAREFTPELANNKSRFAKGLGVSTSTIYYRKVKLGENK